MTTIGIECESIEEQSWGVGRIVAKLLQEISRHPELRKEFSFFLFFKSRVPDLPFLNNPIFTKKIIWQPLRRPSFVLYQYIFLPVYLWFNRVDVMFFPNYMLPILFLGRSLVMLPHDIYYEMRSPAQRFRHRLAYRVFGTWAAMRATKVIAMSESSARELMRLFGIPTTRIAVNPLAVDTPQQIGKPGTEKFSEEIVSTGDYLLFVGQAFPRRRLKEGLEAFQQIAPDFPGLKFVIIGADRYTPPLIKDAVERVNADLGYQAVLHRDYVSDAQLALLYRNARACLYVSSREAFGLPPLEALSYGTPAIIADNQTSRELFGVNAFFVEHPGSVHDTADAMRRALTDRTAREHIASAADTILRRYTWEAHTDRFLSIVRSIVPPRHNP